jgi:Domain of unknown function (DUF1330)
MIAKHGGRYLTKGGSHKLLETARKPPDRVVIIEFPDIAALDRWYTSAEEFCLIAESASAEETARLGRETARPFSKSWTSGPEGNSLPHSVNRQRQDPATRSPVEAGSTAAARRVDPLSNSFDLFPRSKVSECRIMKY